MCKSLFFLDTQRILAVYNYVENSSETQVQNESFPQLKFKVQLKIKYPQVTHRKSP